MQIIEIAYSVEKSLMYKLGVGGLRKTPKTAAIFPAIASCKCKMPPYSRVGRKALFLLFCIMSCCCYYYTVVLYVILTRRGNHMRSMSPSTSCSNPCVLFSAAN